MSLIVSILLVIVRSASDIWTFGASREDDEQAQPALGFAIELEFAAPVAGPVVLGRYAHFGLGQFAPMA